MKHVTKTLECCATFCGIAMTLAVCASAFMRYVLADPVPFTQELVGLLFAALVFLAMPDVSEAEQHLSVDILTNLYPRKLKEVAMLVRHLLTLIFLGWFTYYAAEFVMTSYDLDSSTDIMHWTLWPWMAVMPLGTGVMFVVELRRAIARAVTFGKEVR